MIETHKNWKSSLLIGFHDFGGSKTHVWSLRARCEHKCAQIPKLDENSVRSVSCGSHVILRYVISFVFVWKSFLLICFHFFMFFLLAKLPACLYIYDFGRRIGRPRLRKRQERKVDQAKIWLRRKKCPCLTILPFLCFTLARPSVCPPQSVNELEGGELRKR